MSKLTAKYQIKVLPILIAGKEMLRLEPIKFATDIGDFVIHPPDSKGRKPEGDSQPWKADTLWVDIISDADPSLSREELLAKLNAGMQKHVHRFLRLLRRKLPEIPRPLPAELDYSTSFDWEKPKPGWQLLAETSIVIKVSPQGGLTQERWQELEKELTSGIDTELWEDFLLDSKVALAEDSLIRGVLYAAIACETFIKQYTQIAATKKGISKIFWDYINSRETDIRAVRYYGPILHLVIGHSLENEENEIYKSLERIFKKRNEIMHEGNRSFSKDERIILINDIGKVKEAISWVLNCSKE